MNAPVSTTTRAAGAEVLDVGRERRRIHGHQHVELVARGGHLGRAEVNLEGGHAEGGADRGPDFGRKVGEGGEVAAGQRRFHGEPGTGDLHAVAGIAGETDDGPLADVGSTCAAAVPGTLIVGTSRTHLACGKSAASELYPQGAAARQRPASIAGAVLAIIPRAQTRNCRPPERRQVDALQRPDLGGGAGGELPLRHHRAQHRRRPGARPAARRASRRSCSPERTAPRHRRVPGHRRAGEGRQPGRGARQPVPGQHPRGGRGGPRRPLLRERRHPARHGQRGSGPRPRDHQHRARARRSRRRWRSGSTRRCAPPSRAMRRPRSRPGCSRPLRERAGRRASRPGRWFPPRRRRPSIRGFNLLTAKPVLYAANVGESEITAGTRTWRRSRRRSTGTRSRRKSSPSRPRSRPSWRSCAPEDRAEFLESLGLTESGLDRLAHAAYHLLGLQSYFTAGEKEVRAWTIHKGDRAPAGGRGHPLRLRARASSARRRWRTPTSCGSAAGSRRREQGLARAEGKEYVVQDGDVMLFRFNV